MEKIKVDLGRVKVLHKEKETKIQLFDIRGSYKGLIIIYTNNKDIDVEITTSFAKSEIKQVLDEMVHHKFKIF